MQAQRRERGGTHERRDDDVGVLHDPQSRGKLQHSQTLTAAAMTYVAGVLASIAQLLYVLTIFGRN